MEPTPCTMCGAPARERDDGGYDEFCSDDCELDAMVAVAEKYAAELRAAVGDRRHATPGDTT